MFFNTLFTMHYSVHYALRYNKNIKTKKISFGQIKGTKKPLFFLLRAPTLLLTRDFNKS